MLRVVCVLFSKGVIVPVGSRVDTIKIKLGRFFKGATAAEARGALPVYFQGLIFIEKVVFFIQTL